MNVEPAAIAARLREIAIYLHLEGDRFRAKAYEKAARSVEAGAASLPRLLEQQQLTELPYIGDSIARVIEELARRGTVSMLDHLRARWPQVVVELALLPKVGVVRARALFEALGPLDLDELAAMCARGEIRALKGFSKISEAKLLDAITNRHTRGERLALHEARELSQSLAAHLAPSCVRVEVAGPVRRWIEIVDRLALAVAADDRDAIEQRLKSHPFVTGVALEGETLVATLAKGTACDVHVCAPAGYGWCLAAATGSPDHVELLRRRAAERGVEPGSLVTPDEPSLYRALDLPWIPPEVRDGTDELELDLSELVELKDLTGAFHCHTTWSDGRHSVEEMAAAAKARGLGLITITDHSAAASYAGGLDAMRLRDQAIEIEDAARATGIRVLRGTEADILADGTIDVPPALVGELDVIIASVHQRYKQDADATTARLIAAMRQPYFKIWGHALGRLILRRDPIPVHLDRVLDAIAESRAAIELNGDPHRLDLAPEHVRAAAARGIPFVLSTDAHSIGNLDYAANAVAMARRARLTRRQILNTLPPDELARRVKPS
ncbi:MAG TPA: PHP domain-containing protein [Kofleriaceae bacterium]|nr:PHP domain-containing protein [Kofleriaceae bacterium]